MRSLNNQEINTIHGAGIIPNEFVHMTMYYGAAVGTTAGAIAGTIKIALAWGLIWSPIGFVGGGLMGAVTGAACGAISAIPLSAIFCPPDYAKLSITELLG